MKNCAHGWLKTQNAGKLPELRDESKVEKMMQLPELKKNSVVVIAGPTASGKSALALEWAKEFNGVVINADSMQVYRGLRILSAAPGTEERQQAEHRLYEIYPPSQRGTVVDWLELAEAEIRNCWAEGKVPIVVGGTGLYLDNLINGTTPIPAIDAAVRAAVAQEAQAGAEALYARLQAEDAAAAEMLHPGDMTRIKRALEIRRQTGKSIAEWYRLPMVKKLPEAAFYVVKIIPAAEELDERCFRRFDKMIEAGAEQEVRRVLELNLDKNLPAMKMLGVPELSAFIEGECSFEDAVSAAKLHTRQYAKRQRTWFRNKLKADKIIDKIF